MDNWVMINSEEVIKYLESHSKELWRILITKEKFKNGTAKHRRFKVI
jgi:hypothetical protein